jgi:hypothetical protein
MVYLVAFLGVTICSIAFVFAYSRRLEGLAGPWILNEGRRDD